MQQLSLRLCRIEMGCDWREVDVELSPTSGDAGWNGVVPFLGDSVPLLDSRGSESVECFFRVSCMF